MSDKTPILSLCIPTNGVPQWVFPVLDSIFAEADGLGDKFEVIVTDNGDNDEFYNGIQKYVAEHDNLKYYKTGAFEFLNEIEAYKRANGEFIKFINHRTLLNSGSLKYFIEFAEKNADKKPCVYFLNGAKKQKNTVAENNSFDEYVKNLGVFSSWSTGMGFWKSDFNKIDLNKQFNVLFPHTDILFSEREKNLYIIDNTVLLKEIPVGKIPKGRYNLFNAFAVEYVEILLGLLISGDITEKTYYSVKKDNYRFIKDLYFDYVVRKKPCSYDLTKTEQSINKYYSIKKLKAVMPFMFIKRLFRKTIYILTRRK